MSFNTAFEITVDDIETVLCGNLAQVAEAKGMSIQTLAETIFDSWDGELDRVAKVAMGSGTELEDQTDGAYAEIRLILVEQGILKR